MNILKILFHYLRTIIETKFLPSFLGKIITNRRKKSFLKWLTLNSPYYQKFKATPSLEHFPIIDKKTLMENFDQINTKNLKKEECFRLALASEEDRDFSPMLGDISVGLSSGTSGNRGLFCASSSERALWAGIIMGKLLPKPITSKQKIALFLRANNNLYDRLNSNKIIFKFFDMIIPLEEQIENLESLAPDILVAPASVLCALAKLIEKEELTIQPTKVFSAAEVLEKSDQMFLEKVFNQTIHQIYQCTEGFLAATCTEGNLHINEEYIHIEKEYIDRGSGRFIPIITDLFRTTQPIVRYRLNDILVEDKRPCPCGSKHLRLKEIEGREDDIFYLSKINEEKVIPVYPDFLRRAIITSHPDIEEYKIIQTSLEHFEIQIQVVSDIELIQKKISSQLDRLFEKLNVKNPSIQFSNYQVHELTTKRKRVHRAFNLNN